jgi:hypothetical protein
MKHATKMMVVPYVKPISKPIDNFIHDLDTEMSAILQNNKISVDEQKYNTDAYDDIYAKKISSTLSKVITDNNQNNIETIMKKSTVIK